MTRIAFGTCLVAFCMSACTSNPAPAPEQPVEEAPTLTEGSPVKTVEFKAVIDAPVEEVWDTMLDQETYRQWTATFFEGSYYEGSWDEGERMHFLNPSGNGMCAVIAENRPHELITIKHIGFVMGGVEDTTSEEVLSWAPAYEKYRFAAVPGGTEVTIEQDVEEASEQLMADTWARALAALKALCEEG